MASTKIESPPNRPEEQKVHNINQVEMTITNYGTFGQSYSAAGCWWPIGSGENYIFGAGIWFGTIDNGDTLVTNSYIPNNGQHETECGLWGSNYMASHNVIYMYGDNWPAPADTFPMAPQSHVSHQDSWCCFNDSLPWFHDTEPIGLEFYQTVYVWDVSEIEDIVFFTHEVKNVTDHTLQDCYIAVVTDCDIGGENPTANDRNSGVVARWYVIDSESIFVDNLGYQWQEEPEAGWAAFPGAIGFDLLETPNDIGMTAFKRFTLNVEPLTDPDRYEMLAGYDYLTGLPEPYDTFPSDPDDQRFLISSGPFDLEPDQSATIIFAVLLASWEGMYQTPDTALALIDKWAQYQYDSGWQLSAEENSSPEVSKTSIALSPNPSVGQTKISFTLIKSGMVSLKLYNTVGQLVHKIVQNDMSAGTYTFAVDTRELTQGSYFLILETPHGTASRSLVVLR
jgi:hypothetical protein